MAMQRLLPLAALMLMLLLMLMLIVKCDSMRKRRLRLERMSVVSSVGCGR